MCCCERVFTVWGKKKQKNKTSQAHFDVKEKSNSMRKTHKSVGLMGNETPLETDPPSHVVPAINFT